MAIDQYAEEPRNFAISSQSLHRNWDEAFPTHPLRSVTLGTVHPMGERPGEGVAMLSMRSLEIERTFATKDILDFVDITDDVREAVSSTGVRDGRVTLFSPSSSCALLANERESGLLKDIRRAVDKLGAAGASKEHLHIGASSIVVPLVEGKLRLGTWQRLLLAELEGPSERAVLIQIVGE